MADAASSSPYDDPKSFVALSHALEVVGKYLLITCCTVSSRQFLYKGTRHTSAHRSSSEIRYVRGSSTLSPWVVIAESKEYLLAATTILSTESRHSSWIDSALRKGSAWSGPFDVRSTFSDVVDVVPTKNCRLLLIRIKPLRSRQASLPHARLRIQSSLWLHMPSSHSPTPLVHDQAQRLRSNLPRPVASIVLPSYMARS
jgi:hypothetical protein